MRRLSISPTPKISRPRRPTRGGGTAPPPARRAPESSSDCTALSEARRVSVTGTGAGAGAATTSACMGGLLAGCEDPRRELRGRGAVAFERDDLRAGPLLGRETGDDPCELAPVGGGELVQ